MTHKDEIKKLTLKYERNLQKLREQQASFGLNTPVHILLAIEDIEVEIQKLKANLEILESETLENTSVNDKFPESLPKSTEDITHSIEFSEIQRKSQEAKPSRELKYDVFISYSYNDKEWVHDWLLPKLKEAGLSVWIDFEELRSGTPLITAIEQAITKSRTILIILTPAYLNSQWSDFESTLIQTLDPTMRQRRVIPLMLQPCEIPSRIRTLAYSDFTRSDQIDFQLNILLASIGTEETSPPATPSIKSTPLAVDYNLKAIRQLLMSALVDEELTTLCYDHFYSVYEEFSTGMLKEQKIQRLIEYCERHAQLDRLLSIIKQLNPAQYSRFARSLGRV